jgi:hypothetical protein
MGGRGPRAHWGLVGEADAERNIMSIRPCFGACSIAEERESARRFYPRLNRPLRTPGPSAPPRPPQALPIFLDKMVHPLTAIIISVTAVLFFGEIIPQAVCSR